MYVIFLSMLLITFPVWPQQDLAWLYLSKGINAYMDGRFEESLGHFQTALNRNSEYPEAQYWMGKLYEAQGSAVLALEHYRNALRFSPYLRNREDEISILYSMSDVLIQMGDDSREEALQILYRIVDSQEEELARGLQQGYRYVNLLSEKGLDQLVYLYRDDLNASFEARKRLAELSWEAGEYRSALLNSTRVVLSFMSRLSDEYRKKYPSWRFDINTMEDRENPDRDIRFPGMTDGISELIGRVYDSEPFLTDWLEKEAFWAYMYLLSISLYATGAEESARSIWSLIVFDGNPEIPEEEKKRLESGRWGRLASRQLESPFISAGSISP